MTINWISHDELLVNPFFYNRGIVVIKTPSSKVNVPDNEIISHNDRFSISPIEDFDKSLKYINKQQKFLRILLQDSLEDISDIDISSKMILFNKQRRTEIFFPILFIKEKISIYINAWISQAIKNKKVSFSSVKHFTTAGCIFGSSLKAKDKNNKKLFTLIHMNMDFFSDKKIDSIILVKNNLSDYEIVLFNELERFAKLIQILPSIESSRTIFYHFPYYDYIIFAAVLFVGDILTYEAFDHFHQIILSVSETYIKNITAIFHAYDIDVKIESPYQNIFGSLNRRYDWKTDEILNQLDIDLEQVINDFSKNQKEKSKRLIQNCWFKLIKNSLDLTHQEIWKHFSTLYSEPPSSFKELLERANAMMVARGSWGEKDYTACSLLAHSEKQIQVGYSRLLKLQSTKVLSEVINLTIFDPVVAYTNEENIGLFSCDWKINNIKNMIHTSRQEQFFFARKKMNQTVTCDLKMNQTKNL